MTRAHIMLLPYGSAVCGLRSEDQIVTTCMFLRARVLMFINRKGTTQQSQWSQNQRNYKASICRLKCNCKAPIWFVLPPHVRHEAFP